MNLNRKKSATRFQGKRYFKNEINKILIDLQEMVSVIFEGNYLCTRIFHAKRQDALLEAISKKDLGSRQTLISSRGKITAFAAIRDNRLRSQVLKTLNQPDCLNLKQHRSKLRIYVKWSTGIDRFIFSHIIYVELR